MPESAADWTDTARFCLAILLAVTLSGTPATTARNPQLWPEQNSNPPQYLTSITESDITLTGFHCGMSDSPTPAAFAADPDTSETPSTIGLEVLLEEASAVPQHTSRRLEMDDSARTPLTARLSRLMIQEELSPGRAGGEMQDVFVPEASMTVAELVALCMR